MRPNAIPRIAEVELRKKILQGVILPGSKLRMLQNFGNVFGSQLLEEVRLSGKKSRQRAVEIGSDAPNQPTQFWCSAIIRSVGGELDRGARNPAHELILA